MLNIKYRILLNIDAALISEVRISAALNTILFQENLHMIISAGGGCTYTHFPI